MKANQLIIVGAVGLIAAGPALAEESMWSDLSRFNQHTSPMQPAAVTALTASQKSYASIYDQISAIQAELTLHRAKGVAGRTGDDVDPNGDGRGNWASQHPNASIYEQLRQPSN